jgi:ABC-2 type transport system permease protein
MKTIQFLLEKEFRQIFRNKSILAMILVMPMMQLIILPLAADYEVRNINLAVHDLDHSASSKQLVEKIVSSGYFKLVESPATYQAAMKLIDLDKADVVLQIPSGFSTSLANGELTKVFMAVNAINGIKAGLGSAYLAGILTEYNKQILSQLQSSGAGANAPTVNVIANHWFNPNLNYNYYMVPGILAILLTMVGSFLTSLNIVKEKEVGTIEQINVTPIKKHHFILGKLLPFWVLGNVVFTIGMLVGYVVYGIVPKGSIALLYLFVNLYLPSVLGFGLLVSTLTDTQQQAMFVMFFFMVVFILMGGLFTPIESMPDWAQTVSKFNPVTYLIKVLRMIVLKGSGLSDIRHYAITIIAFGVVLNALAIFNYRKTV